MDFFVTNCNFGDKGVYNVIIIPELKMNKNELIGFDCFTTYFVNLKINC